MDGWTHGCQTAEVQNEHQKREKTEIKVTLNVAWSWVPYGLI